MEQLSYLQNEPTIVSNQEDKKNSNERGHKASWILCADPFIKVKTIYAK
jgi:hypothetical protein